jgi:hypothetical protein
MFAIQLRDVWNCVRRAVSVALLLGPNRKVKVSKDCHCCAEQLSNHVYRSPGVYAGFMSGLTMQKGNGTKRLVESLIEKVNSSQRNPRWWGWPLDCCTIALLMKLPKASIALW